MKRPPTPAPSYQAFLATQPKSKHGIDQRKLVAFLARLMEEDFAPPLMVLFERVAAEWETRSAEDSLRARARRLAAAA